MRMLTRMLRKEHRRAGLYLEEDDHILCLMQGQQVLAGFSSLGATLENILLEADKYLDVVEA